MKKYYKCFKTLFRTYDMATKLSKKLNIPFPYGMKVTKPVEDKVGNYAVAISDYIEIYIHVTPKIMETYGFIKYIEDKELEIE